MRHANTNMQSRKLNNLFHWTLSVLYAGKYGTCVWLKALTKVLNIVSCSSVVIVKCMIGAQMVIHVGSTPVGRTRKFFFQSSLCYWLINIFLNKQAFHNSSVIVLLCVSMKFYSFYLCLWWELLESCISCYKMAVLWWLQI